MRRRWCSGFVQNSVGYRTIIDFDTIRYDTDKTKKANGYDFDY